MEPKDVAHFLTTTLCLHYRNILTITYSILNDLEHDPTASDIEHLDMQLVRLKSHFDLIDYSLLQTVGEELNEDLFYRRCFSNRRAIDGAAEILKSASFHFRETEQIRNDILELQSHFSIIEENDTGGRYFNEVCRVLDKLKTMDKSPGKLEDIRYIPGDVTSKRGLNEYLLRFEPDSLEYLKKTLQDWFQIDPTFTNDEYYHIIGQHPDYGEPK